MHDDAGWIQAALNGNEAAFGSLVARYQRPVFSLCLRMLGSAEDAEDAAQETFVRAFRYLRRYDQERAFGTWLLSIASHYCIDRLRRRRLNVVSLDGLPPWRWIPGRGEDAEEAAGKAIAADRIEALLGTLPTAYRVVVVLRYWHDMGYQEIAELLGDTESAVKSRLHRARRLLAQGLDSAHEAGSGLAAEATSTGEIAWIVTQPAR